MKISVQNDYNTTSIAQTKASSPSFKKAYRVNFFIDGKKPATQTERIRAFNTFRNFLFDKIKGTTTEEKKNISRLQYKYSDFDKDFLWMNKNGLKPCEGLKMAINQVGVFIFSAKHAKTINEINSAIKSKSDAQARYKEIYNVTNFWCKKVAALKNNNDIKALQNEELNVIEERIGKDKYRIKDFQPTIPQTRKEIEIANLKRINEELAKKNFRKTEDEPKMPKLPIQTDLFNDNGIVA